MEELAIITYHDNEEFNIEPFTRRRGKNQGKINVFLVTLTTPKNVILKILRYRKSLFKEFRDKVPLVANIQQIPRLVRGRSTNRFSVNIRVKDYVTETVEKINGLITHEVEIYLKWGLGSFYNQLRSIKDSNITEDRARLNLGLGIDGNESLTDEILIASGGLNSIPIGAEKNYKIEYMDIYGFWSNLIYAMASLRLKVYRKNFIEKSTFFQNFLITLLIIFERNGFSSQQEIEIPSKKEFGDIINIIMLFPKAIQINLRTGEKLFKLWDVAIYRNNGDGKFLVTPSAFMTAVVLHIFIKDDYKNPNSFLKKKDIIEMIHKDVISVKKLENPEIKTNFSLFLPIDYYSVIDLYQHNSKKKISPTNIRISAPPVRRQIGGKTVISYDKDIKFMTMTFVKIHDKIKSKFKQYENLDENLQIFYRTIGIDENRYINFKFIAKIVYLLINGHFEELEYIQINNLFGLNTFEKLLKEELNELSLVYITDNDRVAIFEQYGYHYNGIKRLIYDSTVEKKDKTTKQMDKKQISLISLLNKVIYKKLRVILDGFTDLLGNLPRSYDFDLEIRNK